MNGIKIKKEDWLKLKPVDRDGAMFDCLQNINSHLKRIYIVGGIMAVVLILEFPKWATFIIGKAVAAF